MSKDIAFNRFRSTLIIDKFPGNIEHGSWDIDRRKITPSFCLACPSTAKYQIQSCCVSLPGWHWRQHQLIHPRKSKFWWRYVIPCQPIQTMAFDRRLDGFFEADAETPSQHNNPTVLILMNGLATKTKLPVRANYGEQGMLKQR